MRGYPRRPEEKVRYSGAGVICYELLNVGAGTEFGSSSREQVLLTNESSLKSPLIIF